MRTTTLFMLAVIALVAVGCSPATAASPTPLPAETSAPTAAPPSVAAAARPALTETFSSNLHGMSVSYPEGWVPRAATELWPADDFVQMESPFGDVIEDGSTGDTAFLALASQPLAGRSLDELVAGYGPFTECGSPEPVVVDGAQGVVGPNARWRWSRQRTGSFSSGSTGSTIPNGSSRSLPR